MKKSKILSILFSLFAVILLCVMCAVVAYNYCALQWGGAYAGWSASPSTAFVYAIPYLIAVAICVGLTVFFYRKMK